MGTASALCLGTRSRLPSDVTTNRPFLMSLWNVEDREWRTGLEYGAWGDVHRHDGPVEALKNSSMRACCEKKEGIRRAI